MKANNNLPLMNRRLFRLSFHTQSRKTRLPSQGKNNLVSGEEKTSGITIRKKLITETIVKTSKDKTNVEQRTQNIWAKFAQPLEHTFLYFFL